VSEQIFGLCHLLGFRFAPRIRDLPDRRLFTFKSPTQYAALQDLIADQVDAALIERNWDDLRRLAESIREGKVTTSLLVGKLAAYPQHSELALALRELGRVERTLFTLDWLEQPELRRRAHSGLNKGELRNSLAKALRFYRRGAVADRAREEQQRKASGLNLAIAAIGLWNTVYLQKAIRAMTEVGNPVPENLIPHLSPVVHQKSIRAGVGGRRSARCRRPRRRWAGRPASTWNAEPTTTSARREIVSPDQRLSLIGIYAAATQVYR
jgi:TnpA family transposase